MAQVINGKFSLKLSRWQAVIHNPLRTNSYLTALGLLNYAIWMDQLMNQTQEDKKNLSLYPFKFES